MGNQERLRNLGNNRTTLEFRGASASGPFWIISVIIEPHWNLEDQQSSQTRKNTPVIIEPHWNLETASNTLNN